MPRPESPSALVERRDRLPGLLELWCAFLRPGEASWAERAGPAGLSTTELERLRGLRVVGSRRLFLAGRGLVRAVLGRGGRGGEGAVRLELGPHGKPRVAGRGGVEFNLTHTEGLVACAVSGGAAVGVDAESFGRAAEVFELRGEFMAPQERRVADGLAGGEALNFGLTVWTLKESYFKAVGTGLELPLDAVSLEAAGPGWWRARDRRRPRASGAWALRSLDVRGHRVAVCHGSTGRVELRIRDAGELVGAGAYGGAAEPVGLTP